MPQMFAKRFWGFRPQTWPIISFGLEANRDALVSASRPGDVIAFVGTKTSETEREDQGRLLGLAEIGRTAVDSEDVLDPASLKPSHYNAQGRLRWPKALPMLRAWAFVDRPLLTNVIDQLTYEATTRAVLLSDSDKDALSALRVEEVPVPVVEAIARQRRLQDALRDGATTGPRPISWSAEVSHDTSQMAFTYAMRFGDRNVWKIGHATDPRRRLAEVNKHVPHEVLGERWKLELTQRWRNQDAAYAMEQRVLRALWSNDSIGERVTCSQTELRAAWASAISD